MERKFQPGDQVQLRGGDHSHLMLVDKHMGDDLEYSAHHVLCVWTPPGHGGITERVFHENMLELVSPANQE